MDQRRKCRSTHKQQTDYSGDKVNVNVNVNVKPLSESSLCALRSAFLPKLKQLVADCHRRVLADADAGEELGAGSRGGLRRLSLHGMKLSLPSSTSQVLRVRC